MKTGAKMISLGIAFSVCLSFQANSISEQTAKIGSIAGGAAIGAVTTAGTYLLIKDSEVASSFIAKIAIAGIAGACTGGITWFILDQLLQKMTPIGRFNAADIIVNYVNLDSIIARNFSSPKDFESHVSARFGTSWPLVMARNHMNRMLESLAQAYQLLEHSHNEAQGTARYGDLPHRCKEMQGKIGMIRQAIDDRMDLIVGNQLHERYQFQVQLYEKHLEASRKRKAKRQEKYSDQLHEALEKNNDRTHDSKERNKDRLNKQQMLGQSGNRPVMISV